MLKKVQETTIFFGESNTNLWTRYGEVVTQLQLYKLLTCVSGNTYDDVCTTPGPSPQQSQAPYRPTSGYEDVRDLHQNMPDLLQKHAEPSDISPYATTGNVTVHAESVPSEYAYASVDELKVLNKLL